MHTLLRSRAVGLIVTSANAMPVWEGGGEGGGVIQGIDVRTHVVPGSLLSHTIQLRRRCYWLPPTTSL